MISAILTQLRLLVHLVDSNVGPQQTDHELMRHVAGALGGGATWQYAIVLTKADKRNGKVAASVMGTVRAARVRE